MIAWGAGTFRKAATDRLTCESTRDADRGGWMFKNLLRPMEIWMMKYIGVDSEIRAKGYGAAVDVVRRRVKMKADYLKFKNLPEWFRANVFSKSRVKFNKMDLC